jgi:subtilisin family serine protease
MKPGLLLPVVLAGALSACAGLGRIDAPATASAETLSRQLLITTRQDAGAALSVRGDPGTYYLRRRGYGPTASVDRTLDDIAEDYGLRRVDGWHIASIGEYCEVYELTPGQNVDDMIARIEGDPRIGLVQAMNLFETEGVVYDDPYAPMQPALLALSVEAAHELATGRGVTVAVVDSSADRRHRELRQSVRSEQNLVERHSYRGGEVHGTAVAGVIGSAANNGEGIVGIAPDSKIASLRACWTVDAASGRAQCSSLSLALALESAIRMRADVINLSLAGPPDRLIERLIDEAVDAGIIVVAALPEASGPGHDFPSSLPRVIAAGSSDAPLGRERPNTLRAPGAEVMSTVPNNRYAFFSGNSMAAAYISGVSALVRESRPDIAADELLRLLTVTGLDQIINACRAIAGRNAEIECTAPGN